MPHHPGEGLAFDELYRVAQLPLVAPDHPCVLRSAAGRPQRDGRRPPVVSLVMPIADEALAGSEAFAALSRALSSTRFADKIAWSMLARRRGKLHATVAGSLSADEVERLNAAELRDAMAALGPGEVELRGLFSGRINLGRLYLKAYPQRWGDTNLFAAVQRTLGRATTDLYPVGLLNLDDQLGPEGADELHALIERWWDCAIVRVAASRLVLMRSWDDLMLDAQTVGDLPLLR